MSAHLSELEALRWLKEAHASEPEVVAVREARVWNRVSADLAALSLGLGGAASAVEPHATQAPIAASPTAPLAHSWRKMTERFALWSAPALVAGAAVGAIGHAAFVKPKTHSVYVDRYVTPPAVSSSAAPRGSSNAVSIESLPLETAAGAPPAQSAPQRHQAVATAEPLMQTGLTRERGVLDPARLALAAGEPARALERVRQHQREFPNGILTEEREAIAVNALVAVGQYEAASKRAAIFRVRFPNSLMTYSVDAALAAIPQPK